MHFNIHCCLWTLHIYKAHTTLFIKNMIINVVIVTIAVANTSEIQCCIVSKCIHILN